MHAEGWYQDPFELHQARWFSDGTPTALVRDGEVETHDPPPEIPLEAPPAPLAETAGADDDLLRADGTDPGDAIFDPNALITGADEDNEDRTGR